MVAKRNSVGECKLHDWEVNISLVAWCGKAVATRRAASISTRFTNQQLEVPASFSDAGVKSSSIAIHFNLTEEQSFSMKFLFRTQ